MKNKALHLSRQRPQLVIIINTQLVSSIALPPQAKPVRVNPPTHHQSQQLAILLPFIMKVELLIKRFLIHHISAGNQSPSALTKYVLIYGLGYLDYYLFNVGVCDGEGIGGIFDLVDQKMVRGDYDEDDDEHGDYNHGYPPNMDG